MEEGLSGLLKRVNEETARLGALIESSSDELESRMLFTAMKTLEWVAASHPDSVTLPAETARVQAHLAKG